MKSRKTPIAYKPFTIISGLLAGAVANAIFTRVWRKVSKGDQVPDPTDPMETWRRLALGAAIEGVTFALIKVAADRGAAVMFSRTTGTWPGEHPDEA